MIASEAIILPRGVPALYTRTPLLSPCLLRSQPCSFRIRPPLWTVAALAIAGSRGYDMVVVLSLPLSSVVIVSRASPLTMSSSALAHPASSIALIVCIVVVLV